MRKLLTVLAAAVIAAGLGACVPETTSTTVMIDPDFSVPDEVELDFIQLHNDTVYAFGNAADSPYDYIFDLDISGSNEDMTITVNGVGSDLMDSNDGELFTVALLRHLNDAASEQYPDHIRISSPEDFGGLYELYSFDLTIIDDADDSVLFSYNIDAGDEIDLNPDMESYEEEWAEYMDLYYQGLLDAARENDDSD